MSDILLHKQIKVCLIGYNSVIAQAIARALEHQGYKLSLTGLQREPLNASQISPEHLFVTDYSESSLSKISKTMRASSLSFDVIISCLGLLHNAEIQPEKRLKDISLTALESIFHANTFIPALCLKYLSPLLEFDQESVFCFLSAKLGSIGDNQLGGWYAYRASKSALNMLVKTASIEIKRKQPMHILVSVHPGTTISPLSDPFTKRTPSDKLFTPKQTAERILDVLRQVTPESSGQFYHWDASQLPW